MDMGEDVVFSILVWLPVSALLRFKSVCKSWRSLIESSDFITQHLHHNHHDSWDHDLIILDDKVKPPLPSCHKIDYSDKFYGDVNFTLLSGKNFEFSRNLGFNFKFQSIIHTPKIITCCHGIICLDLDHGDCMVDDKGYYPDIALWNPATRRFTILPDAPVGVPTPEDSGFLNYGLGFDVKTNDYKLVRILIHFLGWSHRFSSLTMDVYSLSTNSWKTVENAGVLPLHTITQNPHVPFRDGIYCWLGGYQNESNAHRDLIVSFDFGSEEFGTIPVPDVYVDDSARPWVSLSFLKENIACLIKPDACDSPTTDIWILNQYGVTDSWIKLYTVTLEHCFYPFGFSKNGKIFWMQVIQSQLTLNLSDPVTHELSILAVEEPTHNLRVANYKESLVSIKGTIGATAIESDIYVDFF